MTRPLGDRPYPASACGTAWQDGRVVVRLEVDAATRAGLVRYGLLAPGDAGKREEVAGAVGLLLGGISRYGVAFRANWIRSLPCASRVMAACYGRDRS